MSHPIGELHLLLGPMFSSKTTELMRQLERYKTLGWPVMAVNHAFDVRYGRSGLYTHDGQSCPAYCTDDLATVFTLPEYPAVRVIGIDESNFFPSLVGPVLRMVEQDHKIVVVAGLSGSFQRQSLGETLQLIPLANQVTLLSSLCAECRDGVTPGIFTRLRVASPPLEGTILVGGSEKYQPVCRRHFALPSL